MASPINSDILIASLLRHARSKQDPMAWLLGKHTEALEAVTSGAEFVTSLSFEGQSSTAQQGMPAELALQLYEAALQVYEAQAGTTEQPGSIRTGDFSCTPCILG